MFSKMIECLFDDFEKIDAYWFVFVFLCFD